MRDQIAAAKALIEENTDLRVEDCTDPNWWAYELNGGNGDRHAALMLLAYRPENASKKMNDFSIQYTKDGVSIVEVVRDEPPTLGFTDIGNGLFVSKKQRCNSWMDAAKSLVMHYNTTRDR